MRIGVVAPSTPIERTVADRVTALAESSGWQVRDLYVGPEPSVALVLLGA